MTKTILDKPMVCKRCGVEKPQSEFPRHFRGRPRNICKECYAAEKRKQYQDNNAYLRVKRRVRELQRFAAEHGLEVIVEIKAYEND